jgi:hypothetical protein
VGWESLDFDAFVAFIDDRPSNRAPKGRDDGTMEVMTRTLATLLAVVPVLIGVAGCATHAPGGSAASPVAGRAASTAAGSATRVAGVMPSRSSGAIMIPAGGQNPQAAIPNPGTGAGNPLLTRALLPLPAACRDITTPPYPGGVKPIAAAAPDPVQDPGAVRACR